MSKVTISLIGVQPVASQIDALAVGPGGGTVVLMGGDCTGLTGSQTLTFDDSAAAHLDSGTCPTGSYLPTDSDNSTNIGFGGGTTPPYGTTMSGLLSGGGNGIWSLFVRNNSGTEVGSSIAGGWSITLEPVQLVMPTPQPQQCRVRKGKKPHKLKGPLARRKFCIHSYMTPVAG